MFRKDKMSQDELDYYYVVFSGYCSTNEGSFKGAIAVKQERSIHGLNLASTYKFILKQTGHYCLIESWVKITKKRHDELHAYRDMIEKDHPGGAKHTLSLIPGGKADK